MKVIVIGGNAAGMSAAARIQRKSPETEVVVYEKTCEVSYGACGLPYYIGGENDDIDLVRIRKPAEFESAGIKIRLNCTVTKVDPEGKTVHAFDRATGAAIVDDYDNIIIASGSSPIIPNIEGIRLEGVFALKTISDAVDIRERLLSQATEKVVIIGGGYIGLEMAEACVHRNIKEIHIVEAMESLISTFDSAFSDAVRRRLEAHNVQVHTSQRVVRIEGADCVESVVTDTARYPANAVILAIGVRPNTDFINGIDVLKNGAIITDAGMRASAEGVYAAGDCATLIHRLTGKNVYIPLGTNANKQGRLVGDTVIGEDVSYARALGTSMIRCLDIELAKTGLTRGQALEEGIDADSLTLEAKSHARYYPDSVPVMVSLCYRKNDFVLLGAQISGAKEAALRIDVLACAIDRGMTAKELGFLDLGYAPPFASVWDAVQIAANAAK